MNNNCSMEGVPGDNNVGRFGYTGQMWLEGAELYHYKARAYDPQLGRFLQPDPIGYGDGLNMYAYVGGDAMNRTDPSGLCYYESRYNNNASSGAATSDGVTGGRGTYTTYSYGCDDYGDQDDYGGGGDSDEPSTDEDDDCDKNLVRIGNVLSESGVVLQEVSGYAGIVSVGSAFTTTITFGASSPVTGPLFAGSTYVAGYTSIAGTVLDVSGCAFQSVGTNSWDPLVATGLDYVSLDFFRRYVPRPLRRSVDDAKDTMDNASSFQDRSSNFRDGTRRYNCERRT